VCIEGKIGFGKDVGGVFNDSIIYKNTLNYDDIAIFIDKKIKGIICETVSYSTLRKFLNKDIGVALTGNEDLPFSLIIMKGFSTESRDTIYDVSTGKYALIKPQTQIRAGVMRPKIYYFE
jgi:phosphomevalonate kinase